MPAGDLQWGRLDASCDGSLFSDPGRKFYRKVLFQCEDGQLMEIGMAFESMGDPFPPLFFIDSIGFIQNN
jgi:hypothetical protein